MYIKPEKTLSFAVIDRMFKEARDPFIAVLNKRHSEIDPEKDLPEMIRIHNATIEAVEDLHQRVSKLEAAIAALTPKN